MKKLAIGGLDDRVRGARVKAEEGTALGAAGRQGRAAAGPWGRGDKRQEGGTQALAGKRVSVRWARFEYPDLAISALIPRCLRPAGFPRPA